jgi:hypothetical protein
MINALKHVLYCTIEIAIAAVLLWLDLRYFLLYGFIFYIWSSYWHRDYLRKIVE